MSEPPSTSVSRAASIQAPPSPSLSYSDNTDGSSSGASRPRARRQFAQRINKEHTAAELRSFKSQAVSRSYSESGESGVSPASPARRSKKTRSQLVDQADILDHVPEFLRSDAADYEHLLSACKPIIMSDKSKELLLFPADDWKTKTAPRQMRTVDDPVPAEARRDGVEEHLLQCIDSYTHAWTTLERKYRPSTQGQRNKRAHDVKGLHERDFQVDLSSNDRGDNERPVSILSSAGTDVSEELKGEADQMILGMLKFTKMETDVKHRKARQKGRVSLLQADDNRARPVFSFDSNVDVQPLKEQWGKRFLINLKGLDFNIPPIEPLFVSMYLYDVDAHQRVSETFRCAPNPPDLMAMLPDLGMQGALKNQARQALFNVSGNIEAVCLVIRFEKTLEGGEIAKCAEPYTRSDDKAKDSKSIDKARANAASVCKRLGQYQMPLAWAALPLASLSHSFGQPAQAVLELYMEQSDRLGDEDLDKYLQDLRKTSEKRSSTKKLRRLSGTVHILIQALRASQGVQQCVNPSMRPVVPYPKPNAPPTLEIEEFPSQPVFHPYAHYSHHLYVYPQSINLQSTSYRNIACRVEFMDKPATHAVTAQGAKCIYSKHNWQAFTNSATTAVSYHDKNPRFHEEVKISLPVCIGARHHLLFSFYHVSCKETKDQGPIYKLIGYAWWPLIKGNKINTGVAELPVAIDLPAGYATGQDTGNANWVDQRKALFTAKISLASTILSDDVYLQNFLTHSKEHVGAAAPTNVEQIAAGVRNLRRADSVHIYRHLHVILNQLLQLVTWKTQQQSIAPRRNSGPGGSLPYTGADVSMEAFETLAFVVRLVCDQNGSSTDDLRAYVKYVFHNNGPAGSKPSSHGRLIFIELARQMLTTIVTYDARPEKWLKECHAIVITNAWFFFDVMIKSIAQYLEAAKKASIPPKDRLPVEFLPDIKHLVTKLAHAIVEDLVHPLRRARDLIHNIARFLRDLLTFADRGKVFDIIHTLLRVLHLDPQPAIIVQASTLASMRLDFLRIIFSHEHIVPLCLPVARKPEAVHRHLKAPAEGPRIPGSSQQDHYVVNVLLNEVNFLLEHGTESLRLHAIQVLTEILACIDQDPRFQERVHKSRIAGLFFPFITMCLEYDPLILSLASTDSARKGGSAAPRAYKELADHERRDILLAFLHVFKNLDVQVVRCWWSHLVKKDVENTLVILASAARLFEYPGADQIRASLQAHGQRDGPEVDDSPALAPHNPAEDPEKDPVVVIKLKANLSTEVGMVVLDTIELFMYDFEKRLSQQDVANELMDHVFDVLISLLRTSQSKHLLVHLFATLQGFVNKFPEILFQGTTTYCAELCEQVFQYCSSPVREIRETASAFLYLLMRKNFEETRPSFSRVKVQSTIALSKQIASANSGNSTEFFLRKSLGTVMSYANVDKAMKPSSFPKDVRDLCINLYQILRDTSQMREFDADLATVIDLHHRIAQGYRNSPDLRLTWLQNMANKHLQNGNYAEAAQCTLHCAALVAEYLNLVEPTPGLPAGCAAFQKLSSNILEESAISEDIISPDEEGVCTHKMFQPSGLEGLLRSAAECFRMAQMYEHVIEVNKLLLPIYEEERDFQRQCDIHHEISKSCRQIVDVTASGKRYLGTYFRVTFFGTPFDADGIKDETYVYKEPGITRLPEICTRLKTLYGNRFGADKVELFMDSKAVDKTKLDPTKAYIQVTFVEPFAADHERKNRKTYFEQNTDLRHFKYETPFTASGKPRGDLEDQQMRKTYLTVEHAFPYVKTRLRVETQREEVLTPLEVAHESIQNKVRDLQNIITAKPTNKKMLQLVLQGSVSVSVNEGPGEIANVFLGKNAHKYTPKQIKKLRQVFGRFLKTCNDALELNSGLVESDQYEYHKNLVSSYQALRDYLVPLTSGKNRNSTASTMSVPATAQEHRKVAASHQVSSMQGPQPSSRSVGSRASLPAAALAPTRSRSTGSAAGMAPVAEAQFVKSNPFAKLEDESTEV